MATNGQPESLDSLQLMLNDVIVQVGKVLKASNKQPGRKNVAQVQASLHAHIPHTIEKFHHTLDDLETEVVRAKSVLQRDLDRFKAQSPVKPEQPQTEQLQSQEPHPIEAQTKSPLAIDLDSPGQSSPAAPQKAPPISATAHAHSQPVPPSQVPEPPQESVPPPMAPFPDMGMGSMPPADQPIKQEASMMPAAPEAMMGPVGDEDKSSADQKAPSAPEPPSMAAPEAMMDDLLGLGNANGKTEEKDPASEFNFTDMTFSLAPTGNESQSLGAAPPPGLDLSNFGGQDDMMNLDQFFPAENNASTDAGDANKDAGAATATTSAPAPATTAAAPAAPVAAEPNMGDPSQSTNNAVANSTSEGLGDIFTLDDKDNGMDLDMSLGDGADASNFDDMFFGGGDMNMEETKFDDAFFGLSSN